MVSDPEHPGAFDELIRGGVILGMLSFTNIPSVHLALLFSAVVDARKEIIHFRKSLLEEKKEVL